MFEVFILTSMLAIGLSQLLPEEATTRKRPGNNRPSKKSIRTHSGQIREDKAGTNMVREKSGHRQKKKGQTPAASNVLKSSDGTGRLK